MELPDEIEWPEAVVKFYEFWDGVTPKDAEYDDFEKADAAVAALIDMVRRFYWQRNELLRLSTAYPAVMKEKLDNDWEKRS